MKVNSNYIIKPKTYYSNDINVFVDHRDYPKNYDPFDALDMYNETKKRIARDKKIDKYD